MMKAKPSDYMGSSATRRKALGLPSLLVSKGSKSSARGHGGSDAAFKVDSLERLVEAFDENERSLRARKRR